MIDLLPAIYQDPGTEKRPNYLPVFLEAFEQILQADHEREHPKNNAPPAHKKEHEDPIESLAEKISRIHKLFDPYAAPDEFLPWLAGWAALSLGHHLSPERRRALIARIIPLYRIRGTREYVEELLEICVEAPTAVDEDEIPALQLGRHSTVGQDMYIGGGAPHYFRVKLMAAHLTAAEMQMQRQLAYEVVELAKPAHTGYDFQIDSPQFQIGIHSRIGVDTLLGDFRSAGVKGV